jgi:hypothetical protein
MEKSHTPTVSALSRLFVHQPVTEVPATGQRLVEIGDAIADVVDTGPTTGEKPGDRRVGFDGLEELDVCAPEREAHDRSSVGGLSGPGLEAKDVAIEHSSLGHAGDGHSDVGQAGVWES